MNTDNKKTKTEKCTIPSVSNCAENKIEGKKYKYMHSGDCILYVTICENCKKEVGAWTPQEVDKKWNEHCC